MFKKILFILSLITITAFAYCNKVTAFKRGEYVDSERNVKVCVYEAFSKNYYYSVATYGMCPMSIDVCAK